MSRATTVTYRSLEGGLVTVTGVKVEGRYDHMYLTLAVDRDVLRIPRDRIVRTDERGNR